MRILNKYGNLFSSKDTMKCQCISADLAMGAGIALSFNKHFDIKNKLENELKLNKRALAETLRRSNGFCIYYDGVFNLVTKPRYYDKPTYESVAAALEDMVRCVVSMNSQGLIPNKRIAMPEIACGLDKLEWKNIQDILERVFASVDIDIEVWHYQKQKSPTEYQQSTMSNPGFEICTGYFANMKKYQEAGYYPVSIAQFTPDRITCGKAGVFAPSKELLNGYKSGNVTNEMYDSVYRKQLDCIPDRTWHQFVTYYAKKCAEEGFRGIVLMCYEKSEDMCHRHILADYIMEKFQTKVEEIVMSKNLASVIKQENSNNQEEIER